MTDGSCFLCLDVQQNMDLVLHLISLRFKFFSQHFKFFVGKLLSRDRLGEGRVVVS